MAKVVYQQVAADRHVFVDPVMIDGAVVETQAAKRLAANGETTYIHYHAKHVRDQDNLEIPTEVDCRSKNHKAVGIVSHQV